VRAQHVRALTGVRFFAALYVILYHHQLRYPNVLEHGYPNAMKVLRPVLAYGMTGVDLFFLLSGFVLAHNYLALLGDGWHPRDVMRFLWLRLARIWPLYVFSVVMAGAFIWLRSERWGSAPVERLSWSGFLDQLLMVEMWHRADTDLATWAGPMWTISVEWLAYLLFPLLALVVLRLRNRLPAWALLLTSGLVMLPFLFQVVAHHGVNAGPYQWLARILCEFVAGMLVSAGTSRLRPRERSRGVADLAAIGCVLAGLMICFGAAYVTSTGWHGQLIVIVYVPFVACLALADGHLSRLLSTRVLVLGGAISYGMYLVHSQLLYLYRDAARYSRLHLHGLDRERGELLMIVVIILVALVLHRLVEEPARRWMSRLVARPGTGRADVEETAAAGTL